MVPIEQPECAGCDQTRYNEFSSCVGIQLRQKLKRKPKMKYARQVAVSVLLLALILCSWFTAMDIPATQRVDDGLKRALVTFATARAVSGLISVAQGTQVDIAPAGVGLTFAPGQLLAPINELLKHLADLMLLASVAFGIQKVLIGMSGYWVFSVALTAIAISWAGLYLSKHSPPAWLTKVLLLAVMLRFAMPLVILGSDLLSERFLAQDYATSQKAIDITLDQTSNKQVIEPTASQSGGLWGSILNKVPKIPDVKAQFDEITKAAEAASEHMIKLMVIFLLQTLVMPLLLLWGLYGTARSTFTPSK